MINLYLLTFIWNDGFSEDYQSLYEPIEVNDFFVLTLRRNIKLSIPVYSLREIVTYTEILSETQREKWERSRSEFYPPIKIGNFNLK